MATAARKLVSEAEYPTGDGKPMAETPRHRRNLTDLCDTLEDHFRDDDRVYVSGNMLMYYVRGDKHQHVSPDVFMVRGIARDKYRPAYFVWEEGKGPDCAIELTSASTRHEDLEEKFVLYRDVLKVREYFLFDPDAEYLDPPLQGYRLVGGKYVRIKPVAGRLPSKVLGLHLERDGWRVRLYDPRTGQRLPTPREAQQEERRRAEQERRRAEQERRRAEQERRRAEQERRRAEQAEAENQRLRRELETLRRRPGNGR